MAIDVTLFKFNKKVNSTREPGEEVPARLHRCLLKDDCSIINPVLEFRYSAGFNPGGYNYAYIPDFSRCYFVNDWVYQAGIWVASCTVDVLASFRNDIFNQTAYVIRAFMTAAGQLLDGGDVIDTTYPALTGRNVYRASSIGNPLNVSGVYVCGIINDQANNGSVTYYCFTQDAFARFCAKLYNYSDSNWLRIDVSEISENLQKALINPFQYVVSCVFIPADYDTVSGAVVGTVRFGWWTLEVPGGGIKLVINRSAFVSGELSLEIPRSPYSSRGAWTNTAPFAFYTLKFYPFGTVDVDSVAIAGYNTLDLHWTVDVQTGQGFLTVSVAGQINPIRTLETQVGVPIPTASVDVNFEAAGVPNVVAGGASLVSSIFSGGGSAFQNLKSNVQSFLTGGVDSALSSVKGAVSNVASAAAATNATVESIGSQGCMSGFRTQPVTLSGRFLVPADEDRDHRGRPMCQVLQLSGLRGFVQVADAEVQIAGATERETEAIQAYLEGGCFLE